MRRKKVIEAHIVLSTVVMMMDKSLWGLKEGWENIPGTTLRVRKIQTFFNFHDLIVFYFLINCYIEYTNNVLLKECMEFE